MIVRATDEKLNTRLNLDALLVLKSIHVNGSLGAAAKELNRVPSALTYTLKKLESDLNLKVFSRTGKRLHLTKAGEELLHGGIELLKSALELENHVKKISEGWEPELRISLDNILPVSVLFSAIEEFYKLNSGTRVKINHDVLAGTWDSVINNRCDLVLGAAGPTPSDVGLSTHLLKNVNFVLAAAPTHPIHLEQTPLSQESLKKFRVVAVTDTSINLAPRTVGIFYGQETLNVPDMQSKLLAQVHGLGVGNLPEKMARPFIQKNLLRAIPTIERRPEVSLFMAWKSKNRGKALEWFVDYFKSSNFIESLEV